MKKENKIQRNLIKRIIKDQMIELKGVKKQKSIDGKAVKGSIEYSIGLLKIWLDIIEDDEKHDF